MDIGTKLKNARIDASMTQEQVAEALGVSRQTVSNWENERTYPDIVSVVRLSDLYAISLDRLLKGEEAMPPYLNYLSASTDTVKSNDRRAKLTLILTYLAIWAAAILVFWCFTPPGDAMAYSLTVLWVLLPVATFVLSLLLALGDHWGRGKWLAAPILGVLYMLAEYATFSAANMVSFAKFNPPSFGMIAAGAIISGIGLTVGWLVRRRRQKNVG